MRMSGSQLEVKEGMFSGEGDIYFQMDDLGAEEGGVFSDSSLEEFKRGVDQRERDRIQKILTDVLSRFSDEEIALLKQHQEQLNKHGTGDSSDASEPSDASEGSVESEEVSQQGLTDEDFQRELDQIDEEDNDSDGEEVLGEEEDGSEDEELGSEVDTENVFSLLLAHLKSYGVLKYSAEDGSLVYVGDISALESLGDDDFVREFLAEVELDSLESIKTEASGASFFVIVKGAVIDGESESERRVLATDTQEELKVLLGEVSLLDQLTVKLDSYLENKVPLADSFVLVDEFI